jgi:PTS system nitrogen regulatory IIA component
MQMDVRAAAAALKVPETTLFRWIDQKRLPATGIDGHYRFGRAELLEWVTTHRADLACDLFAEDAQLGPLLATALEVGGIHYDLSGTNKTETLRSVVDEIRLPAECPNEMLLQLMLAREALGSMVAAPGIAIPHPRYPVVLPVPQPALSLCIFSTPLDLGAAGRKGVHALFVLICPTVRAHLQLLARLVSLVRDEAFARALADRKPAGELLSEVRRVEKALVGVSSPASAINGGQKNGRQENGNSKKPASKS